MPLLTRGVVNLLKAIHFNIPYWNLNGIQLKLNPELGKVHGEKNMLIVSYVGTVEYQFQDIIQYKIEVFHICAS